MAGAEHDVIVVGAGPAGSTVATLLARGGLRVLVLEKHEFPRETIGESLLPGCMPVLARLGVEPTDDAYVYKGGADFVCEDTVRAEVFPFREALPGCPEHAWHVERSLFDGQLRDAAVDAGARVQHGCTVQAVDLGPDLARVTWKGDSHGGESRATARYFIDATGQGRFLARRQSSARHCDSYGRAAVYTHFDGLGEAYDEVFGDENNIRIMVRRDGWGWIIPLPHRRLSIGLVSRDRVDRSHLDGGLLAGPLATRLTAGARRGETRIVGNYSYDNVQASGPRYASIGDARSFLDPVFSSGVTLAMRGAEQLADAVLGAFASGSEADPGVTANYDADLQRAYDTFGALVSRFYHRQFAESFFLRPMPDYEMRRGIMSVLAGDVWREDNPFQEMLLRGRARSTEMARTRPRAGIRP